MKQIINILKISKVNKKNIDYKLFLLGIFLLASAPFIGTIILIYPLSRGLLKKRFEILRDKYNFPLLFASIIMILKCIFEYIHKSNSFDSWNPNLNWIGLFNWVPLFLCFFGFQPYLSSLKKRITVSKIFVASAIPVLISGFAQFFFKITGPFQLMNGLVIWYQRPIDYGGLTSLFNNPNYAGGWLNLVFPFCLSLFYINHKKSRKLKSALLLAISISFTICLILTNSRGAWIGLIASIPIVIGKVTLYWIIPLVLVILVTSIIPIIPYIPNQLQDFIKLFIPEKVSIKISEILLNIKSFPRLEIWKNAIEFIISRPLLGWGAATFSILYFSKTNLVNNHAHNLFLELSINYGLLVSLSIFITILYILNKSSNLIFNKKNTLETINDRAWWAATFVFLLSHMYDVLYYDIRISISSWIFVAGLRVIIREEHQRSKS